MGNACQKIEEEDQPRDSLQSTPLHLSSNPVLQQDPLESDLREIEHLEGSMYPELSNDLQDIQREVQDEIELLLVQGVGFQYLTLAQGKATASLGPHMRAAR